MSTSQSTWNASNLCTDICKTIFVILEIQFHHETRYSALMTRISDTNMLYKTEKKTGKISFFKTDQIMRKYEKRYPSDKKRDYVVKWQTPHPPIWEHPVRKKCMVYFAF